MTCVFQCSKIDITTRIPSPNARVLLGKISFQNLKEHFGQYFLINSGVIVIGGFSAFVYPILLFLYYADILKITKSRNWKKEPVIAPIITSLIKSFTLSTFPLPWKKAEIVLILKSGDSEEPANTRPIPLLPILSKVCERAAHLQFTDFLHSNNVIHHLQSGNRKLHSTEAALLHFTDELLNNMDQKKISVIVLFGHVQSF